MKRTVQDNSKTRFFKDLAKKNRGSQLKGLPRGFKYIVSVDGTLMVKNLKTGNETPVA